MKNIWIPLVLCTLAIGACSNTAEGVKEDTSINGQKTAQGVEDLSKGAKKAGDEFGAATTLGPKVKLAITADKRLNDPANLIDVDASTEKVTLKGHVTSSELKDLAAELTAKVLKETDSKQSIDNQLEIKA